MDMNIIQGGIVLAIVGASVIHAMNGSEKEHKRMVKEVEGEDVVDPGDLGGATEAGPGVAARIVQGISDLDIKTNAEGLVTTLKGIPLTMIPNSTIGEMTDAVRDWCQNAGRKMERKIAFNIASNIQSLYKAKMVAPEEKPTEAANDSVKPSDAA